MEIEKYITHRRGMRLVDEILEYSDNSLIAKATINEDNLFYREDIKGVPSWLGLEYMAQTAAAWMGKMDELNNRPITLGFLLGTRDFETTTPVLEYNRDLLIKITVCLQDSNTIVFNGEIHTSEQQLASASFTAYRPDNVDKYLRGEV